MGVAQRVRLDARHVASALTLMITPATLAMMPARAWLAQSRACSFGDERLAAVAAVDSLIRTPKTAQQRHHDAQVRTDLVW